MSTTTPWPVRRDRIQAEALAFLSGNNSALPLAMRPEAADLVQCRTRDAWEAIRERANPRTCAPTGSEAIERWLFALTDATNDTGASSFCRAALRTCSNLGDLSEDAWADLGAVLLPRPGYPDQVTTEDEGGGRYLVVKRGTLPKWHTTGAPWPVTWTALGKSGGEWFVIDWGRE